MKLETGTLRDYDVQIAGRVKSMGMDENSQAMVYEMFTDGIYSDPISSIMREVTSNAVDSHREANKYNAENPVLVELIRSDVSDTMIKIRDNGIGMSPDIVENVFGKYFSSTKRNTNSLIGGFGIGGKSPLAYTDSFTLITVSEKENDIKFCKNSIQDAQLVISRLKNQINDLNKESLDDENSNEMERIQNIAILEAEITASEELIKDFEARLIMVSNMKHPRIKYTYGIFNGEKGPAIDPNLGMVGVSDDCNSSEVLIPVKESDVDEFEKKTLRQLYYFEYVIFKGFSETYLTNNYTIINGENFLYRGKEYSQYMHLCYGDVAYPLDYDVLGLSQYEWEIPVAVKIEIGELENKGVNASREALKYTKNNVTLIKRKMEAAKAELLERLIDQYQNITTLFDYYRVMTDFGKVYFKENDTTIYLGGSIKKNEVDLKNFKFKDLKNLDIKLMMDKLYTSKLYGKKYAKRYNSRSGYKWTENNFDDLTHTNNVYYVDDVFQRNVKKQGYLKSLVNSDNFYVITPNDLNNESQMFKALKAFSLVKIKDSDGLFDLDDDEYLNDKSVLEYVIPRKKAEKLIKELFEEFHAEVIKKCRGNYNKVVVPQEYLNSLKKNKLSKELLASSIPVKEPHGSRERVTLDQLMRFKGKIYYGFAEDSDTLKNAQSTYNSLKPNEVETSIHAIRINNSWKKDRYSSETVHPRGVIFIGISKGNEEIMHLLNKHKTDTDEEGNPVRCKPKAIHVDKFYETFVSRKIDRIVEKRFANRQHKNTFDISNIFNRKDIMEHVAPDVYEKNLELKKFFRDHMNSDYGYHVTTYLVKNKLNIDIENIIDNTKFKYEDTVKELVELSEKNQKRFKWFELPHRIDTDLPDHKELISMISLMFER